MTFRVWLAAALLLAPAAVGGSVGAAEKDEIIFSKVKSYARIAVKEGEGGLQTLGFDDNKYPDSGIKVAENTNVIGGKRVIIQTEPGTTAGSQELSRQLGTDSIVSSLGPNTYRAEKNSGITPELIEKIKKLFGSGTKVYSDDPQKLSPPPGK